MDLATIGSAYNGLKFVKDALKLALDLKIENESRLQINAALEKLGDIQDTLFELREDLTRLQTENDKLRREIGARAEWESMKSQYELTKTEGAAVVYRFTGQPEHFACPSCHTKETIQILQDKRVMSGAFECPSCKATFPVKPPERWGSIRSGR